MKGFIKLDTVGLYNKLYGVETLHPLVSVIDSAEIRQEIPTNITLNYGIYALYLKHAKCGDLHYGRQTYDYQEGTVTSFAPGQVVEIRRTVNIHPQWQALAFHPDLIRGTSLGRDIKQYSFFSYASNEALHLSDEEKGIYQDCLEKIRMELSRPVDKHSRRLISRNVELLLDYCMRFYDRQFVTREKVNRGILVRFEEHLDTYFQEGHPQSEGLPTVKYFADRMNLSPNYFGDLVKKETGRTAQEYIQGRLIEMAKQEILGSSRSVSEIAYRLGFQYPQHFTRIFKKLVGCTPTGYRERRA